MLLVLAHVIIFRGRAIKHREEHGRFIAASFVAVGGGDFQVNSHELVMRTETILLEALVLASKV